MHLNIVNACLLIYLVALMSLYVNVSALELKRA
jgi:hypothetical protein